MKTFFSSKGFHRQVLINNPSIKLFQNLFPTQSYILFYFFFKKRKLFQFLFPFHVTVVSLYPRKIDSLSPNTLVCDLSNPLLFDFQKNLSKRYLCFYSMREGGKERQIDQWSEWSRYHTTSPKSVIGRPAQVAIYQYQSGNTLLAYWSRCRRFNFYFFTLSAVPVCYLDEKLTFEGENFGDNAKTIISLSLYIYIYIYLCFSFFFLTGKDQPCSIYIYIYQ